LFSINIYASSIVKFIYDTNTKLYIQDIKDAPKLSWQDGKQYCSNLSLGGYDDWYMPSISQMVSFEDRTNKKTYQNKNLKHTKRYDYWSSTQDALSLEYAWSAGLMYKAYNHTHNKKDTKYIRCVRSDKKESENYYIKYKDIVVNKTTNIMWQDNKEILNNTYTYKSATEYCKNLNLMGYDDWILPDIYTLRSLVDYNHFAPALSPAFKYYSNKSYYSNTPYQNNAIETIGFNNGIDGHIDKYELQYARCVRYIKPTIKTTKISVFFNYDNAVLYIDGKRWGKLHTMLDDFQITGDINISVGIHHLEVKRVSRDKKYEISGVKIVDIKENNKTNIINVLALKKEMLK